MFPEKVESPVLVNAGNPLLHAPTLGTIANLSSVVPATLWLSALSIGALINGRPYASRPQFLSEPRAVIALIRSESFGPASLSANADTVNCGEGGNQVMSIGLGSRGRKRDTVPINDYASF